MELIVCTSLRT